MLISIIKDFINGLKENINNLFKKCLNKSKIMILHFSKNLKTKKNNKLRNKYFKKHKRSHSFIHLHKILKKLIALSKGKIKISRS